MTVEGKTPLDLVVQTIDLLTSHATSRTIELLVDAGGVLTRPIAPRWLQVAIFERHLELVQQLVRAQADINDQTNGHLPPLFLSVHLGLPEVSQELLAARADVNGSPRT